MTIPVCMVAEEIRLPTIDDKHISMLSELYIAWHVISESQSTEKATAMLALRDEIAIMDSIALEGKGIIKLALLQEKALDHLPINYMGIEKTRLLA